MYGIAIRFVKYESGRIWTNGCEANFAGLCASEAVHTGKYVLQRIDNLETANGSSLSDCFAFVGNLTHRPSGNRDEKEPSTAYLKAIASMLKDRRVLKGERNVNRLVEIDIQIWSRRRGCWLDKGRRSVYPL